MKNRDREFEFVFDNLPIRQQLQDFLELGGNWFNVNLSLSVCSWTPLFITWSFWSIWNKHIFICMYLSLMATIILIYTPRSS